MTPNNRVDFDKFTDDYSQLLNQCTSFFTEDDAYFAAYKIQLMKSLVDRPVHRILEYGCGIGRNIPFLKQAFPEAQVIGTDISAASLEIARQQQPDVQFLLEDDNTNEALGAFDLIFVAGVFHHVPPADRAMVSRNISQRLAPNGELFAFEHNPYNPVTRRIVSNCAYDEDAILLQPQELKHHLTSAGLVYQKTEYCLFIPPKLKKLRWLEPKLRWLPLGGQYFVHASKLGV